MALQFAKESDKTSYNTAQFNQGKDTSLVNSFINGLQVQGDTYKLVSSPKSPTRVLNQNSHKSSRRTMNIIKVQQRNSNENLNSQEPFHQSNFSRDDSTPVVLSMKPNLMHIQSPIIPQSFKPSKVISLSITPPQENKSEDEQSA